jgi:hypothetical protein
MRRAYKVAWIGAAALAAAVGLLPRRAGAEHFAITLRVISGQQRAETIMDTTPPIGGVNPRPVVMAHPGDEVRVDWRMRSSYPHGIMKDVTVHFFVVREEKLGQKPVPDPAGSAGVVDNSFVMDFAPDAAAQGALRFRAGAPGNYLVRVQSENTHQEHGHEHFSAIDLHVE